MTKPMLVVAPDPGALARLAADHLVRAARRCGPGFRIAVSGGSTPQPLYRLLASPEYRDGLPWADTHLFFADERAVPPDSPDSNFGLVESLLLSHVPLAPGHVHRMRGEAEDLQAAAKDYEWELAATCEFDRGSREPRLDVVLLGIGDDGHTASLFRGSEALREEDRWVAANYVPGPATPRLTLTYPVLAAAGELVFLVSGAGKAGIVRRVLEGDPDLPATRAACHPRATFLLDAAAAP
ncbi:MAG: 6-phosphogluconolactonase [Armatimonadetes bacterium]|nr:6-phosphogluconolactonase [Armatimonadota bacterium]